MVLTHRRNKISKVTYKLFLSEKNFILSLINKTRIIYYSKLTVEKKIYTLFETPSVGIFNFAITFAVLKATFKQIMQITLFKGVLVVGALDQTLTNIGLKLFYTFDKWQPGFITNFVMLMKHTLIYIHLKKKKNLLLCETPS